MLHPYTKCLTKVLQASHISKWKYERDLVKSSELAWSIEDFGKQIAPKNDYLFKYE
jgi:hypothetical protein